MRTLKDLIQRPESWSYDLDEANHVKLEQLRAQMAHAESWLERARNAIPKKTRKWAEVEKVDLGEMKGLLDESGHVSFKERADMASVVETAEDWIGKSLSHPCEL